MSAYLLADHTLVDQMLAESLHYLDLLLCRKTGDCKLNDATNRGLVDRDKTIQVSRCAWLRHPKNLPLVVHECEKAHDELTVHTVRHAAVSGNGVAKVLDVEGSLET